MFHMHGTLDKYRQSSYLVNYKLINNVPYVLHIHISCTVSTYHLCAYNSTLPFFFLHFDVDGRYLWTCAVH